MVEKGKRNKKKIHTHLIIETPTHLSVKTYKRFILNSWLESKGGIKSYDFTNVLLSTRFKEVFG